MLLAPGRESDALDLYDTAFRTVPKPVLWRLLGGAVGYSIATSVVPVAFGFAVTHLSGGLVNILSAALLCGTATAALLAARTDALEGPDYTACQALLNAGLAVEARYAWADDSTPQVRFDAARKRSGIAREQAT